jgi:hypothetical protein
MEGGNYMFNQRIQNLLVVAIVAILVTMIAYLLTTNSHQVAAQVQEKPLGYLSATELTIDKQQRFNTELSYQGVYSNPNTVNPQGEADSGGGQLEAVDDLESALSDSEIDPQSTNSGAEFVPASALRSDGFPGAAVGYRFSVLDVPFPGGFVNNISADFVCMAAPVYLPDGATVTRFSMYFMDDHPTLDVDNVITLWRKSHTSPGNSANAMASLAPAGVDSTSILRASTTGISNATVNNNFGYYVTICLYPNTEAQHLVYGFSVDYN